MISRIIDLREERERFRSRESREFQRRGMRLSSGIIAERLSARQLILRRISEIVCMYVSVTLRNPIISRATRKRSITCASVTLRNVTAEPAIAVREKTKSSLYVQL